MTTAEHIERLVDEAPPLSDEQAAELAAVLTHPGGST